MRSPLMVCPLADIGRFQAARAADRLGLFASANLRFGYGTQVGASALTKSIPIGPKDPGPLERGTAISERHRVVIAEQQAQTVQGESQRCLSAVVVG